MISVKNRQNSITNDNIIQVPILKPIGSNNGEKLTFESLLKFIENNKEYLLNPINNSDNEFEEDDQNFEDNILLTIDEKKEDKEMKMLGLGDVDKIDYISTNLKKIFHEDLNLIRAGVLSNIPKLDNNVSFVSSIITCLISNFNMKPQSEQINYIKCVIEQVNKNFINFYTSEYKKLGWDKNTVFKDLQSLKLNYKTLKIYTDYFHVNIFLLNLKEDKLYFTNNIFIPFKKNLFLIQINENVFEPIFFNEKKFLQHNYEIINTIINNNNLVSIFGNEGKDNKFMVQIESLEKYLSIKNIKMDFNDKLLLRRMGLMKQETEENKENNTEKILIDSDVNNFEEDNEERQEDEEEDDDENCDLISETDNDNNNNKYNQTKVAEKTIFYKKVDEQQISKQEIKYNKKELEQKKIDDIKNIATKLNISLKQSIKGKEKLKTKSQLIDEILK